MDVEINYEQIHFARPLSAQTDVTESFCVMHANYYFFFYNISVKLLNRK